MLRVGCRCEKSTNPSSSSWVRCMRRSNSCTRGVNSRQRCTPPFSLTSQFVPTTCFHRMPVTAPMRTPDIEKSSEDPPVGGEQKVEQKAVAVVNRLGDRAKLLDFLQCENRHAPPAARAGHHRSSHLHPCPVALEVVMRKENVGHTPESSLALVSRWCVGEQEKVNKKRRPVFAHGVFAARPSRWPRRCRGGARTRASVPAGRPKGVPLDAWSDPPTARWNVCIVYARSVLTLWYTFASSSHMLLV